MPVASRRSPTTWYAAGVSALASECSILPAASVTRHSWRAHAELWSRRVDLTPELLAVARRRAADAGYSDITWIEGDAENLPLPDGGFGAVFTDVDQPDGSGPGGKHGNRKASTLIEYFGADGELLFSSFVPASPGDGSLSFFGIVFDDARIARVRIETGNVAPGPNDDRHHDIVMMDDFIYGEPQLLQREGEIPRWILWKRRPT